MANIEFRRYPFVVGSILAGARTPYPHELQRIADIDLQSDRKLKSPEIVIEEVAAVPNEFPNHIFVPYRAGMGLTRSDILVYFSSFADSHRLPLNGAFTQMSDHLIQLVTSIEHQKDNLDTPLGLQDQLRLALEQTEGNSAEAVLALAIGTRLMARAYDTRIASGLVLNRRRQFNWKHCVAPLSVLGETNDPAGDTYHYWHGVLAGLSSSEKEHPYMIGDSKNTVCSLLYAQTAGATQFLRYGISSRKGRTHSSADRLGFQTGVRMYELYASK